MANKALKWLNIVVTLFPVILLPVPVWMLLLFALAVLATSFLKPVFEPIPTIIESIAWGFGLYFLFIDSFDWLSIIGIVLFAVWLFSSIVYLIFWFRLTKDETSTVNCKYLSSKAILIAIIIISVLLVVSIVINIYQYVVISNNQTEIKQLNNEISYQEGIKNNLIKYRDELLNEIDDLRDQLFEYKKPSSLGN